MDKVGLFNAEFEYVIIEYWPATLKLIPTLNITSVLFVEGRLTKIRDTELTEVVISTNS